MELQPVDYVRKSFTVRAVEVTFENVNEVAKWCKGKTDVEKTRVLGGAEVDLPIVKFPGQGADKGKELVAKLGNYVVEFKNRFQVYKEPQFFATFERPVVWQSNEHESDCNKQHQGEGCACDLQKDVTPETKAEWSEEPVTLNGDAYIKLS